MLDPIAPSAPTARDAGTVPASASGGAGDFQTFLTMLTTQMQNQNPLEPIEASDFAAQLATFSGVEQQVHTNDLLTRLVGRMGLADLAGWVGREVLSPAPVRFEGELIRLVPPEVDGANRAELVVTDSNGREVGRYTVDPQSTEILFEVPETSTVLEHGAFYGFSMVSYRDEVELAENPVLGYAPVMEARTDSGRTLLVLAGGQIIDSDDVVGLRDPAVAAAG
ncbi:MAG: flagellar basal-body rod modification protein FlgD [Roseibaca calidilacus]|uniref:Basal-body rod modification protein FlgD n=1 Tax=Roseibaca calidilacus TaxID=1666912 RepID=A0A0P7W4J9_9RHOB|nr:flagellar hook capping FlgD N-terminal domain-containing protein [Roseibaca calidilacus]KPP91539.1 MAG: flagellar basal-body rod modification protein FlgD [Roseibaca calidilacus]CUX82953.1 flagellar basal-body rod modification protein FlgD [Roseibaca calidilacus]